MKITRERLRQWGACYDDAKIAALVPEDGLTPLEFAALDIPVKDRLKVLLREDIIPARDLRLLACGWAESACHAAGLSDERSLAAIAVAQRLAVGEATEDKWKTAWAAARSAILSAGRAAAARSAARVRSSVRARSAAARSAAAEAQAAQLADVVRVLKQIDEAAKAGKVAK